METIFSPSAPEGTTTPTSPDGLFPPAGFIDQATAAARIGISARELRQWIFDGRLDYGGEEHLAPRGVRGQRWVRLYDVVALDAAHARKRDDDAAARAARATLPDGFIDRAETARLLEITPDTLALWYTNGRLRSGRWWHGPDGRRTKIYPRADVERLLADLARRATLPEGFVDIDGVVALAGVSRMAVEAWLREGKIPRGELGRSTTHKPCRLWRVDMLRAALDALRGADRVYLEAGDSRRWHIPDGFVQLREACAMLGVSETTLQRWESEGLIECGRSETKRRIRIYPRAEIERIVAENGRYAPPYPDPDRPGVWRVPLAGESMSRREALIDAADVELVRGRRFHFSWGDDGERFGKVSTFETDARTSCPLHRLILNVSDADACVGHRNDDPLDCRRENLVVRTLSERNANNRKARTFCGRPPTSRFKGVCFDRKRERWVAYIKKDGVNRSLGRYHDELAAAEAYDAAARELFGEHARLNFPDGVDAWLERETAPDRLAA